MPSRLTPVSSRESPCEVSLSPSHHSLVVETAEEEEGQFDDAKVEEVDELPKLHPSEQPLPSSPSPSPTPSPSSLSLVDRMVEHILQEKHQVSEVSAKSETPDKVATAVSPTGVPQYSLAQDHDDVSPMDTSAQGDSPNVLDPSGCDDNEPPKLLPLRYIPLPLNVGHGTLIKQLFAPHGAFAAPSTVCPSPASTKPLAACSAPGLSSLPPLLSQNYVRPMTIKPYLSCSLPTPTTPVQAALDRVTSPRWKQPFVEQSIPEDLSLPKPYSVPLPRTSPVTPVLDEPSAEPVPSPADSENDLPLNSIPVAELLNAHLSEDASLMPIILSRPGLQASGTAMKLLVSAPKKPRRHYGRSRNQ